jgi:hypothetical protein
MLKTKATRVELKVGVMHHRLDLPAGLRCKQVEDKIVLDEFPYPFFPPFSFIKNDGEKGLFILSPDQVITA